MTLPENSFLRIFKAELDRPISRDVYGVLEIPSIYPVDGVFKTPPRPVPIRLTPEQDSIIVMMVQSPDDLISSSIEYEWKQAIVYGQTQGWYLVHSLKGRGWIQASKEQQFTSIGSLLCSSQISLDRWDQKLYSSPTYPSPLIHLPFLAQPATPINLTGACKDVLYSNGTLWLKIIINAKDPCQGTSILPTDIEGWIPAYNTDGYLVLSWWATC